MTRYLFAAVLAVATVSSAQAAPFFSVDPASPAIALVPTTESDILTSGPGAPVVVTPGAALGLAPFDNVNALSSGKDQVIGASGQVFFSVDRLSLGDPGTGVEAEVLGGPLGQAPDVFRTSVGAFTNALHLDNTTVPLMDGFFGDDIDALNEVVAPDGMDFFSIDFFSPSNGFGAMDEASDIFFGTLATKYADGVIDIGLAPGDDIDALILVDVGTRGVLDPGLDQAFFSISSLSTSAFTGGGGPFSPADILYTNFTGIAPVVALSSTSIGLMPTDELNALYNPEPGSLALLACGLGGFAIYRRRKNKK